MVILILTLTLTRIISKQSRLVSGSPVIGSVPLWVLACNLLSEMQNATRGDLLQGSAGGVNTRCRM